MKDWLTPEKHEEMVAMQNHGNLPVPGPQVKTFQCWTCDALVRTTDWPPVLCGECRAMGTPTEVAE